ncbi:MAG TPA: helix-turn-helix domain-containing protein [Actinomycetota bacterium]|jgi:DNA-binding HxlR family transcriptional regulator|nr:helix-turn-helix domain-containing protein [Actinomycetota bacterium]
MELSARDSFCPHFQKAIELVGKRWSGTILRALMDGPRRFSEIASHIPQISDRSLSLRLKELEAQEVIVRRVEPTQPVSVSYELTAKGRDLESVITELERWAHEWVAPPEERTERPEGAIGAELGIP